jgi:hypothetical protein
MTTCASFQCNLPVLAKGLCSPHYQRARRGRPLDTPLRERTTSPTQPCPVEGCERLQQKCGLCQKHYAAKLRHGDPAVRKYGEYGAGHLTAAGYRVVYAPQAASASKTGYLPEHRLVMEEILGRALRKEEHVHHKNGQRADNRPENLELWVLTPRQPKGQRVEDLLAWAKEIVHRYDGERSPS